MRIWSPEVAVVSLLVMVVLVLAGPAVLKQREQARQQLKNDRLRQIGLSLSNYHDTFQTFPAGPAATKKPAVTKKKSTAPARQPDLISPL